MVDSPRSGCPISLALEVMGRLWLPTEKHWRLNERHYGGLTGLDKAKADAVKLTDAVSMLVGANPFYSGVAA